MAIYFNSRLWRRPGSRLFPIVIWYEKGDFNLDWCMCGVGGDSCCPYHGDSSSQEKAQSSTTSLNLSGGQSTGSTGAHSLRARRFEHSQRHVRSLPEVSRRVRRLETLFKPREHKHGSNWHHFGKCFAALQPCKICCVVGYRTLCTP